MRRHVLIRFEVLEATKGMLLAARLADEYERARECVDRVPRSGLEGEGPRFGYEGAQARPNARQLHIQVQMNQSLKRLSDPLYDASLSCAGKPLLLVVRDHHVHSAN